MTDSGFAGSLGRWERSFRIARKKKKKKKRDLEVQVAKSSKGP